MYLFTSNLNLDQKHENNVFKNFPPKDLRGRISLPV